MPDQGKESEVAVVKGLLAGPACRCGTMADDPGRNFNGKADILEVRTPTKTTNLA